MNIINKAEKYAKEYMSKYDDSHNFDHALRVKSLATKIALSEGLNNNEIFEIIIGSILHDINDHKYSNNNMRQDETLRIFFNSIKDELEENTINRIIYLACNVSLTKELNKDNTNIINYNLEKQLNCIRDADRIESLGALGISRYFTYGIINNKSNIDDVIKNIEHRTAILLNHIKTDMGKKISAKKYIIIKSFIDDYYNSIHNYQNY
jgi:uncharacterized protein